MLIRLMSKSEYIIVPKGMKFTGSGKLGLIVRLMGVGRLFMLTSGVKSEGRVLITLHVCHI